MCVCACVRVCVCACMVCACACMWACGRVSPCVHVCACVHVWACGVGVWACGRACVRVRLSHCVCVVVGVHKGVWACACGTLWVTLGVHVGVRKRACVRLATSCRYLRGDLPAIGHVGSLCLTPGMGDRYAVSQSTGPQARKRRIAPTDALTR